MSLKAIFEYRDWKTAEPDWDNPGFCDYSENQDTPLKLVACPEPSCRKEQEYPGASGPILASDIMGAPSLLAMPCVEHADFQYTPGWYKRWAEADEAQREEEFGKPPPAKCNKCSTEFTTFLAGWYRPGRCPECTYQHISNRTPNTMTLVR